MAAPGIPNLNTLRSSTGGRLRGASRARGGLGGRGAQSEEQKDRVVQQTDQDASQSRISAVAMGYLHDPFAQAFLQGDEIPRRYPIINRGTYTRTTALDTLIDAFLQQNREQRKQIISLGAGSDTRFYRQSRQEPRDTLVYHEIDFPANNKTKVSIIKNSPAILKAITSTLESPDELVFSREGDAVYSPTYNVHSLDLRVLASGDSLPNLPNLSPDLPTLILSECCLCYLSPDLVVAVLDTVTQKLLQPSTPLALVLYEPIQPFDAFGRVMESNLAARGIHLQTLHRYSTLSAQKARLRDAGFTAGQCAADVRFIFENWIPSAERERIAKCEMMDELEEWHLLAEHYCIAWGWRGGGDGELDVFGEAWKNLKQQPGGRS